jgi:hypothetical protein
MDAITQAFTDAIVKMITTIGDQSEIFIIGAFVILGGWMKAKFSAPAQRQAILEAALQVERDVAGNPDDNPTGPEKKARAIKMARKKLPLMHAAILSLGPKVEEVMPQVKRMSNPPPAPDADADSDPSA